MTNQGKPINVLSDIMGGMIPQPTDVTADTRPIQWEEDGYTVIRGHARSGPGCHNACGILQYVKDGKLVKIEGDPENPYNQGRLCSRCLAAVDVVYHEERLKYPMKRARADRGLDKFERITWDEAYQIIETEFKRIAAEFGPETIMCCQGTGRDIHQVTRLNAVIGSPNEGVPYFAGNSCYLPRIASMACMLGDAAVMDCSQFLPQRYDDPRYEVPEYCIIWGHQPFYANADGFFGHWITDLMQRGMKIAVIDPELTWPAARAGADWLRVRPGADGALAMAMLKIIIEEELYDADFCDKWVFGLDGVKERIKDYDLEVLAARTWVDLEDIRRVARTYAAAKPAAIQWGVAIDQSTGGQQAAHAITSLWTITGNLDVPGGNVIGRPCWGISQPNWTGTWGYEELIPDKEPEGRMGSDLFPLFGVGFKNLSSNATFESWVHQPGQNDGYYGPYKYKAAYFVTNNFLACMGAQTKMQLEKWYRSQLDFIVWSDLFMNPSMFALADIVLPVTTFAERIGFGGLNPYSISAINPAIEPLWDTRPDQTIFMELGKRVARDGIVPGTKDAGGDGDAGGNGDASGDGSTLNKDLISKIERQYKIKVDTAKGVEFKEVAYPWNTVEEMWDYALQDGDFTWKELQHAVWKMPDFKYRKYETGDLREDGQPGFQTPTGRAEIQSKVFEFASHSTDPTHYLDPLPSYIEPHESPYSDPEAAEQYPYICTTGKRVPHFFHSEHRQVKRLRALHPEPLCHIHPDTAKKHGIEEGEWFWLWNSHGKCKYKAAYNNTYDPRVMQCEHAWWFPERANINTAAGQFDIAGPEVEAGPFGVFESNCNNMVPLPAGVSGFGANYKAIIVNIGKDEPAQSNVTEPELFTKEQLFARAQIALDAAKAKLEAAKVGGGDAATQAAEQDLAKAKAAFEQAKAAAAPAKAAAAEATRPAIDRAKASADAAEAAAAKTKAAAAKAKSVKGQDQETINAAVLDTYQAALEASEAMALGAPSSDAAKYSAAAEFERTKAAVEAANAAYAEVSDLYVDPDAAKAEVEIPDVDPAIAAEQAKAAATAAELALEKTIAAAAAATKANGRPGINAAVMDAFNAATQASDAYDPVAAYAPIQEAKADVARAQAAANAALEQYQEISGLYVAE